MLRGLERRLVRAEAGAAVIAAEADAERAREAGGLLKDSIAAAIRAALAAAGLDPAEASCLRRHDAARGGPPAVPPAPLDDATLRSLKEMLAHYVRRLRGHPPPLAGASMAELFAFYCLSGEDAEGNEAAG